MFCDFSLENLNVLLDFGHGSTNIVHGGVGLGELNGSVARRVLRFCCQKKIDFTLNLTILSPLPATPTVISPLSIMWSSTISKASYKHGSLGKNKTKYFVENQFTSMVVKVVVRNHFSGTIQLRL